jgi:pimeloyl-ACP methyl ester carboxylesterase
VITGLFLPSLACGDYSLLERINLWRGKKSSGISCLWSEMLSTDLNQKELRFNIPIYFFEGIYDYTCSYSLAKDYFEKIEAPIKGFYTFHQSAHSPIFEEPERAQKILLQDVLGGVSKLSD